MSTTEPRTIRKDDVVTLRYTLKSAEGEVIESSEEDEDPILYLHGAENLLPALEALLEGRKVGERLEGVIPCDDAFGERDEEGEQKVPLSDLPADLELEEGEELEFEGPDGEDVVVWVKEVGDEHVVLDSNHPLAGLDLHYAVEVLGIRDATPEELEHGHPHGEDGHEEHDD